jgi:hypothetical protein
MDTSASAPTHEASNMPPGASYGAFNIIPDLSSLASSISTFYSHTVKPYIDQGSTWIDKNLVSTVNLSFKDLQEKASEYPQLTTYGTAFFSGVTISDGVRRLSQNKYSLAGWAEFASGIAASYYLQKNPNEHTLLAVQMTAITVLVASILGQPTQKTTQHYIQRPLALYPHYFGK